MFRSRIECEVLHTITLGAGIGGEDVGDGACKVDWEGEVEAEGDGVGDGVGDGDGGGVGDVVATVPSGFTGMVTVLISPGETGSCKSPNIKVICVILTFI